LIRLTLSGLLLVVIHTFEEIDGNEALVRIISARKATARERAQYERQRDAIGEPMKDEYDFSNAQRGKFFRKDAVLDLPVYLDPGIRDYLAASAKAKGVEVNDLVNELLKRDIELIKAKK
jgi:acetyl-CoA carboxylase carboxyltransferase component